MLTWSAPKGEAEAYIGAGAGWHLALVVVKQGFPRHKTPWAVFVNAARDRSDRAGLRESRRLYLASSRGVVSASPQSFTHDPNGQAMAVFASGQEARKAAAAWLASGTPGLMPSADAGGPLNFAGFFGSESAASAPRYANASRDWQTAFAQNLERRAAAEAAAQRRAHLQAGRRISTFRYNPPDWHREAVAAMGRNDEAGAKAALLTYEALHVGR